ncbi:3159_t:CDS:2, partial [Scutellospora calospora]
DNSKVNKELCIVIYARGIVTYHIIVLINLRRIEQKVLVLQNFEFKVYYKNKKRYGNTNRISRYLIDYIKDNSENENFVEGLIMYMNKFDNKTKNLTKRDILLKHVIFKNNKKYEIILVNYQGIAEEKENYEINRIARKWRHKHIILAVEELTEYVEVLVSDRGNSRETEKYTDRKRQIKAKMEPYKVQNIGKYRQVYLDELDKSKLKDSVTRNRIEKLYI